MPPANRRSMLSLHDRSHMQQSSLGRSGRFDRGGEHRSSVRRWHASGYQVSIFSSLFVAACISVFFIAMAGWGPSADWQELADFSVTWILLTYIWVQMGSLILVGAGTKNQMWLDALTSILPLFSFCMSSSNTIQATWFFLLSGENRLGYGLYHAAGRRYRSWRDRIAELSGCRCGRRRGRLIGYRFRRSQTGRATRR